MGIVSKNRFPILILISAVVLRFYKLGAFTTFLSDQGRDAIIVKRIVTFEHWPAIGPPTSLGHVFLGPFYYYLISPFLFITRLDPVGMASGVALLSIIGLAACYLIVRREYDKQTADIYIVLITFFAIGVEYSRFSWNPNPLFYFSFITLYLFYKSYQSASRLSAFAAGVMLALSVQLHYLALFLILPVGIMFVYTLVTKKRYKQYIIPVILMGAGFVLFISPLILFDLKHDYINVKNLLAMLGKKDVVSNSSVIGRLIETNQAFISHILLIPIHQLIALLITSGSIGLYFFNNRSKNISFALLHALTIILYLIAFSLLESFRHPHYYISIYYSIWFLIAGILAVLYNKHLAGRIVVLAVLLAFIGFNARTYYFFYREEPHQIGHARRMAAFLADKINKKPYNIATWPIDFTEDTYLYFLELQGLVPANREKIEVTDQMFVLCNKEPCSIINSPSWNINMFGRARIANTWEFERVKIYKLVHEN